MTKCEICYRDIVGNYFTITLRYWVKPISKLSNDDYCSCKIIITVCERCANRDTSMYRDLFGKLDEKKPKLDRDYQKVI